MARVPFALSFIVFFSLLTPSLSFAQGAAGFTRTNPMSSGNPFSENLLEGAANDYKACLERARSKLYDACLNNLTNSDAGMPVGTQEMAACDSQSQPTGEVHDLCIREVSLSNPTSLEHGPSEDSGNNQNDCPPGQSWIPQSNACMMVPAPTRRPTDINPKKGPTISKDPAKPKEEKDPETKPGPETASTSDSEIQNDTNACLNQENTAVRCCGNPASCGGQLSAADQQRVSRVNQLINQGPSANQSVADYCRQLNSLSNDAGKINSSYASVCAVNQNACVTTCNNIAAKYARLLERCPDCASKSKYQSTLSWAKQHSGNCATLSANARDLAQNSVSPSSSGAYSKYCSQNAGTGPPTPGDYSAMSAESALAGDNFDCQSNPSNPACQNCDLNPSGDGCAAKREAEKGTMGWAKPGDTNSKEDFNPKDLSDAERPFMGLDEPSSGVPVQVGTVANNSGGGVPQGGGANSGNQLDAKKPWNDPKTYTTDIDRGLRSGGYTGSGGYQNGFDFSKRKGSGGAVRGAGGQARNVSGLDLKQYLPGGANDPRRRVAGYGLESSQIRSKEDNIWHVISNKFTEKCKLAMLWHCQSGP